MYEQTENSFVFCGFEFKSSTGYYDLFDKLNRYFRLVYFVSTFLTVFL